MTRAYTPEEKKQAILEKKAEQAERAIPRRERRAFGVPQLKLSVSREIPGHHIHWVNDEPGRIHSAEESGYQFVTPDEVGMEQGETRIKRLVGKNDDGTALYAYLMKIKQEWYDEDQRELQSNVDRIDSAIRRGTFEDGPGQNRYVPREGIKIK